MVEGSQGRAASIEMAGGYRDGPQRYGGDAFVMVCLSGICSIILDVFIH